jgi:hypothetical protein
VGSARAWPWGSRALKQYWISTSPIQTWIRGHKQHVHTLFAKNLWNWLKFFKLEKTFEIENWIFCMRFLCPRWCTLLRKSRRGKVVQPLFILMVREAKAEWHLFIFWSA